MCFIERMLPPQRNQVGLLMLLENHDAICTVIFLEGTNHQQNSVLPTAKELQQHKNLYNAYIILCKTTSISYK